MRTARTYLSPIHELHSLRWTAETGQKLTLTQKTTVASLAQAVGLESDS